MSRERQARVYHYPPEPAIDPYARPAHEVPVGRAKAGAEPSCDGQPSWPLASAVRSVLAAPAVAEDLPSLDYEDKLSTVRRLESSQWLRRVDTPATERGHGDHALCFLADRFGLLLRPMLPMWFPERSRSRLDRDVTNALRTGHLVAYVPVGSKHRGAPPMLLALGRRGYEEYLSTRVNPDDPDGPRLPADFRQIPQVDVDGAGRVRAGRFVRHDQHVAGWSAAFMACCGPQFARCWPQTARVDDGRRWFRRIEPGRTRMERHVRGLEIVAGAYLDIAHDERAVALRLEPDATIELKLAAPSDESVECDVLVEFQRRATRRDTVEKLRSYDVFLAGWCLDLKRYRVEHRTRPLVVFVFCTEQEAIRAACWAEPVLRSCLHRNYAWDLPYYGGREHLVFCSEEGAYRGDLHGWMVPRQPLDRACKPTDLQQVDIVPGELRRYGQTLPLDWDM